MNQMRPFKCIQVVAVTSALAGLAAASEGDPCTNGAQNLNTPTVYGGAPVYGQTFTAEHAQSCGAQVAWSNSPPEDGGAASGSVTMELWDDLPQAGGTLLATDTYADSFGGTSGWTAASWDPVTLQVGQVYYLRWTIPTNMAADYGNQYSGGQAYINDVPDQYEASFGFAHLGDPAPPPFEVTRFTIDAGGGDSSGGIFELSGTMGQPDAQQALAGGDFEATAGFWGGIDPGISCFGDFDEDGNVATSDLLGLLSQWGTSDPLYDIVPNGVVDTADLLALLSAWGPCTSKK